MTFTYTYTGRSQDNPNKVITFTIYDDYMKINLTGLVDQVSEIVDEEDQGSAIREFLSTQSGSAIYKAVERLSGPVHINDVSPVLNDTNLKLVFWKRIAGLRFAPLVFSLENVDNPQAAQQFIDKVSERQQSSEAPGFFSGPLDYWGTWFALIIGIFVLIKWPRKRHA